MIISATGYDYTRNAKIKKQEQPYHWLRENNLIDEIP